MRITEAKWEKRNLGKQVLEVLVEDVDTSQKLLRDLKELKADYLVVKVPTALGNLVSTVQAADFDFMEVLTHTIYDEELPSLNQLEKKYLVNMRTKPISLSNRLLLELEVISGLFKNDRISLDEKFDKRLSGNRYLGMIKDECAKGAIIYEITYKEHFVGFYILRLLTQTTSLSSIGGIMPSYQNKGIGILMNYFQIMKSYELGATEVSSTFSSNNVAATHIHWKHGYKLVSQEYIFVKHL